MAIGNDSQYIGARAAGRTKTVQKASIANQTVGGVCSLWRSTGPLPTQPLIPAATVLCNNTTQGALDMPSAVAVRYIDELSLSTTVTGAIHLCDRVLHSIQLSGVLTTAQTVNTPTLPARAPAVECEWWLEWYADTGATGTTASVAVTYTDSTTGTVSVSLSATMRAGRRLPIIPAAGKIIASIQSVTLAASTGTAGAFGVVCSRRLIAPIIAAIANIPDRLLAICQAVASDCCLELMMDCAATSTGVVSGSYRILDA
jgi:hypothetical protein